MWKKCSSRQRDHEDEDAVVMVAKDASPGDRRAEAGRLIRKPGGKGGGKGEDVMGIKHMNMH